MHIIYKLLLMITVPEHPTYWTVWLISKHLLTFYAKTSIVNFYVHGIILQIILICVCIELCIFWAWEEDTFMNNLPCYVYKNQMSVNLDKHIIGVNICNSFYHQSYTRSDLFLSAQYPLPDYTEDFLRLVKAYYAPTVVSLQPLADVESVGLTQHSIK